MEIQFYDVTRQRKVSIPLEQIKKALFKRTTRNGKVRIHYILVTQLNGTVLRKFVRRDDWMELDIPQV